MFRSTGVYVDVPAAGTPVRLTSKRSDPTARLVAHTIFIQQVQTNIGKLYLCGPTTDPTSSGGTASKTTGSGILAIIPAPTLAGGVATTLPYIAFTLPYAPGGFNVADYYLDADNSGEKALVSFIKA